MSSTDLACPRCSLPLSYTIAHEVAPAVCDRCGGIWLDREEFRLLCDQPARYARLFGPTAPAAAADALSSHLSCPHCVELMHRKNFPTGSEIAIDLCIDHGVWFDQDELRRILTKLSGAGGQAAKPPKPPKPKQGRAPAPASGKARPSPPPVPSTPPPVPSTPPPASLLSPAPSSTSSSSITFGAVAVEVAIEGVVALIAALLD